MTVLATVEIELHVIAPLLCAGIGRQVWGVDKEFLRDHRGQPLLPASHVKGKLREAWRQLFACRALSSAPDIDFLLGLEPKSDDPEPGRGLLELTDFRLTCHDGRHQPLHRIKIDEASGTVKEQALLVMKPCGIAGQNLAWHGGASYPAENEEKAVEIRNALKVGLAFITSFGSEKGIGFGRLTRVEIGIPSCEPSRAVISRSPDGDVLGLRITAREPLLIGGLRIADNLLPSEPVISGAVIKGALAQALRRRLGVGGIAAVTGESMRNLLTAAGLPLLGEYFDDIGFSHAFPSCSPRARAVTPPLSLVQDGNGLFDLALAPEGFDCRPGQGAPMFRIDWKDGGDAVDARYGWRWPRRIYRTRTAIEGESGTATEGKLYSFQFLCPEDETGQEVHWLANVRLPTCPGDVRRKLAGELDFVLRNWLIHLGKRYGAVEVEMADHPVTPCRPSHPGQSGRMVVSLQTDTLLLDPFTLASGDEKDVSAAYQDVWTELSGGTWRLARHFASQKLTGGYIGRRFTHKSSYCPWFLTAAGSVFVLEAVQADAPDMGFINDIQAYGLPLPGWVGERYGPDDGSLWRRCPYLPENGYGEVAINLDDHFDLQVRGNRESKDAQG